MKDRLAYFGRWRARQLEREKDEENTLPHVESFLSKETYLNLRVGICGFVALSRYMVENDSTDLYIPVLFSNSSVCESFFASIRTARMDFASNYAIGVSFTTLEKAASSLSRGKCYTVESIGDVKRVDPDVSIGTLKKADQERTHHLDTILKCTMEYPPPPPGRFEAESDSETTKRLLERVKIDFSGKSLAKAVFGSSYYHGFIRASLNTEYSGQFRAMCKTPDYIEDLEVFMAKIMVKCIELCEDLSTEAEDLCFNGRLFTFRYATQNMVHVHSFTYIHILDRRLNALVWSRRLR